MPTDFWFRFSTYLSLALACVCLGYAEWQFLPEVTAFTGVVVLLLVVSFFLDRRFELGLGKANALGLGIGVAAFTWMAYHLSNPPKDGPLAQIDWPTNMLPLLGPVLMTLVPAKLFRPKHVGDWWAMHGVAVAGVALASSMSDDAWFVALLAAYALSSGWALVLFFYRRSGGFIPPIPTPHRPLPPQAQLAPPDPEARPPRWVFARTVLWLSGGAAVAVVLYVVLPRSSGAEWVFTRKFYVTGDTTGDKLVMSKAGDLKESDEVAFRFTTTAADGTPKEDLDPDLHWRTKEFVKYTPAEGTREGAWSIDLVRLFYAQPGVADRLDPTDFGPGGYTVDVELEGKQAPVVPCPVRWVAGRPLGRAIQGQIAIAPTLFVNGSVLWTFRPQRYTLIAGPGDAPDLGTPFELIGDPAATLGPLRTAPPPLVQRYARKLVADLIQAGRLPPAARLDDRDQVPEEHHARAARAFADHLRDSGEFTYTTTLEPKDRKLDPLVDFLKNSKAGHCEWFAGSLVLLLRAVGIPAQLVTGFRGWELDEDGRGVVRQRHAHAWVEAIVSRPAPPDFPFRTPPPPGQSGRVWQWLTLDPTPGAGPTSAQEKTWLEQGASLFTDFFLRFDKAKQEKTVEDLKQTGLAWWPWLGSGLVVAAAGWLAWRWRKRQTDGTAFDGPEWYVRLQATLAARGFTRAPGQTPREFADTVAAALPPAAEVVQFVTSKLYRVRYAGSPLAPTELALVTAALDRLEQTLTAPGGSTP
ncbi:MAG: transglutaminaseTgpA domain-containing protein [Fimbriiglobus sp.]|jgi:transglutaminase-like putative cysteine protease|nr:transglutaminaseTgpA domain-containing protein [Fimbriiglobus sp.]